MYPSRTAWNEVKFTNDTTTVIHDVRSRFDIGRTTRIAPMSDATPTAVRIAVRIARRDAR